MKFSPVSQNHQSAIFLSRTEPSLMKTPLLQMNRLFSVCLIFSAALLSTKAASILKQDDSKLLNDPTAWNGGIAPGSGDVAQFGGATAYATTNTWVLGANTTWGGIQVLAPTNSLTITNDGSSLTLGSSGFDLSQPAANVNFTVYPNISFSTPQIWNITNSRTLTVWGSVSGTAGTNALDIVKTSGGTLNIHSASLALRATQTVVVSNNANAGTMNIYAPITDGGSGYGITKVGAGTLSLRGTNAFSGPVIVNVGTMSVETNANIPATSQLIVNTGGSFTANAGGTVSAQTFVRTNTSGAANVTVNGTIAGNITVDPGTLAGTPTNQFPLGAVGTSAACGFVSVNGGGSLAVGGYITNNGVVKFTSTSPTTPITFGTFVMNNGLGGIWDANQAPKTFTFPNNSSLAYFRCDSNEVSTLQVAGNGTCNIRWLGYNDANSSSVFWSYTNTFSGGTWNVGQLGQNNSNSHYVGNATLTGGANMTVTNLAAYVHGTWNIINGSLTFWTQLAENHQAGNTGLNISVNNSGGGPGTFVVTNGGFNLGLVAANGVPENNSLNVAAGGSAYIKGTFQIGTSTAHSFAETNAVNLSGGKLVVNGAIQSIAVAGAQDRTFNWTGGQLSAQTITTSAGFNDPASYIGSSTVSNTAGILAPGDTATPGKTTITGNYVQTAGGTLAIDIGGATQANAFTNLGSYYDTVAVSGSANVAGQITANLIGGYTPTATTAFTVLTGAGGLIASPSTIGYNGLIPVYTNGVLYGGQYMQLLVSGSNLILTNYGVNVGALAAKFSPTNAVGVAPTTPTFTDNSTGVITNRHWDFGDGNTLDTTATSVPHTYSVIGTYTVTLTVTALDGSTSTATGTVKATLTADNALWKGGLSGNIWDLTTANWFTNGVTGPYHDPDFVTFDDSGNATSAVNVSLLVQPSSVTFSNVAKNYVLSGVGQISGNAGITLAGDGVSSGGIVTLLTTNNYNGATVINFGTLQVGNGSVDGGIDNTPAITNNGALIFNQNSTHNLGATLAGNGSLTKLGTGTLILSGDNSATYTGNVTVNGGTLAVSSDSTLGQNNGILNLTNSTLQLGTGGTLNRNLSIGGTNVSLNVNGTIVLQNAINGVAQVTVGGAGTLQIDNGGSSVSLPTNVVLNGGSLTYDRTDNYSQPGTIAGSSVSSAIDNLGGASTTNSLTFANGNNSFASIINEANSYLVLNGSANSSNTIAGVDQTGGGAFGPRGANSQIIVSGGNYFITNSTVFGTVGGGFQSSDTFIVNGGTVVASWYGANAAATDGGLHFFRNNLEIDSGTLYTKVWGAAIAPGFDATFNMNGGTFRLDDSGTLSGATAATTFFGLGLGNHSFANKADKFSGAATVTQTGGAIILAASTNNNVELGCANSSPTNHASTYTISGGTLTAIGGANGGNINIGGSADGASTSLLTLNGSGKISISGAIQGYSGASGSQAFTFGGGTLVAGGVNMNSLADAVGNAIGTLVNNGGTLSPGDSGVAGKTAITGNYTANSGSTLSIDLNGATAATAFTNSGAFYDTVAVSGTAMLGGNLVVRTNGSYVPSVTSAFTILTGGSVSGTFANLTGGRVTVSGSTNTFGVLVTASSVILTNFSGAASSQPSPASITTTHSGSTLTLNWPSGQGWHLQAQTNSLGSGLNTNWSNVTGATPPFNVTPNAANGTVFYRLAYP
jgi:fibronectin-binding autotransporter adhesin